MTQTDPFLGHVIGDRYRITKRIGKGGFGAVFEAEHVTLKRLFAIKVLARQLELDPRFLKRFEHEARLTASLEHPHIVQVTDFGHDERMGSWFAMEYLRGEDLQARIARDGRLDNATAVKLMRQIVDAFVYAHKQGVIHRDVKSANVFLVSSQAVQDHVKVLDFGIARVLDANAEGDEARLTKTGAVMGSPAYMAPEQALNLKVDARTDIYALGIVLYEMVTGRVPFTATSALAVLTKQIKEAPSAPSEIVPDAGVSPHLELAILRCLQKKMDRRYQTTEELAQALNAAEEHISVGDDAPTELIETLSGLRTDMLADGSLLADSSEIDQRRIVAGRGYTAIQRELQAEGDARTSRRALWVLAVALVATALLGGAWWVGNNSAAKTSGRQPLPEVKPAPAAEVAPNAATVAPVAARKPADTQMEAKWPETAQKEVQDEPAHLVLRVVLETDPVGALVRWKDGDGDVAVAPYGLDVRDEDAGRILVVAKNGFVEQEVPIDVAALKKRPRIDVKLEPLPAPKPAQKAVARPKSQKVPAQPESGGFLDDQKM